MARRRPDRPSLVAGLAIAVLGVMVLLDQRFAELAPLVCAVTGAILLASGLSRSD